MLNRYRVIGHSNGFKLTVDTDYVNYLDIKKCVRAIDVQPWIIVLLNTQNPVNNVR